MKQLTKTTLSVDDMYRLYYTNVKQYFLKYTHNEMQAEDMTHDLFLKLLKRDEIILAQTALALLFTIASRMVTSDARHASFVRRAMAGYGGVASYEDYTFDCKELAELEQEKIDQLPPRMRAVYIGTRFEGKQAEELAKEMNIKKRTIESQLFVARREVRNYVKWALAI